MEKIVEHGLLYDFYGELLTAHQRQIYEDAVYHDMSLAEIADIQGISRQGVHDLIRRCDKILEQYEERLGLVKKFARVREKVRHIERLAEELSGQAQERSRFTELQSCVQGDKKTADRDSEKTVDRTAAEPEGDLEKLLQIRTLSVEIIEEL